MMPDTCWKRLFLLEKKIIFLMQIDGGWKNCNNMKLLINAFYLSKKYPKNVTFDFDEPFDERNKKLKKEAQNGFVWAFF